MISIDLFAILSINQLEYTIMKRVRQRFHINSLEITITMKTKFIALACSALLFSALCQAQTPKLTAGLTGWFGASDLPHNAWFNDGIWSGIGPTNCSTVWLKADAPDYTAYASYGIGDQLQHNEHAIDRMQELWVQVNRNDISLRVGKVRVPLAIKDWEVESKTGAELMWKTGNTSADLAVTYNETYKTSNTYLRVAQKLSEKAEVALSLAGGKGLSYDGKNDKSVGADANIAHGNLAYQGEFLKNSGGGDFWYAYSKISYTGMKKVTPFYANYGWGDQSGTYLDHYRAAVYGVDVQVAKNVVVQGAYTHDSYGHNNWIQVYLDLSSALN